MASPSLPPLFSTLLSLFFLLLLHLGCFVFCSSSHQHPSNNPKRKLNLSSPPKLTTTTPKAISSSWSFIKRIFSPKTHSLPTPTTPIHHDPSILSPSSSTRSLPTRPQPDCWPTRIHPCPLCGEVFQNPTQLEQHQSTKHAVSELFNGDSGNNIVRIIFKTGWPENKNNPIINRILKIRNSKKILNRFEEYRDAVKSKAARNGVVKRRDERCIADGNELLRFHCSTFMCELGQNGNSSLCNNQYCNVCEIINSGFSPKMDGIPMQPTGWRGHVAVPEEIEEEFGFMNVKRAMLVCRVIAGRVGCDPDMVDKGDPGFDSLVGRENNGVHMRLDDEDELLVFNPRAVLPCFVIVYTV